MNLDRFKVEEEDLHTALGFDTFKARQEALISAASSLLLYPEAERKISSLTEDEQVAFVCIILSNFADQYPPTPYMTSYAEIIRYYFTYNAPILKGIVDGAATDDDVLTYFIKVPTDVKE